jgi:hypothetical protein
MTSPATWTQRLAISHPRWGRDRRSGSPADTDRRRGNGRGPGPPGRRSGAARRTGGAGHRRQPRDRRRHRPAAGQPRGRGRGELSPRRHRGGGGARRHPRCWRPHCRAPGRRRRRRQVQRLAAADVAAALQPPGVLILNATAIGARADLRASVAGGAGSRAWRLFGHATTVTRQRRSCVRPQTDRACHPPAGGRIGLGA